jgi:hypothetical protein
MRRLFNFAAAASLLLCVGAVGLWVRSYWIGDVFDRLDTGRITEQHVYEIAVRSTKGVFFFYRYDWWIYDMSPDATHSPRIQYTRLKHFSACFLLDNTIRDWKFRQSAGFGWKHEIASRKTDKESIIEAAIPLWLIAMSSAILPVFAIPSWRRGIRGRARPAFPVITDVKCVSGDCDAT